MIYLWMEIAPGGGFWSLPYLVDATDDDILASHYGRLARRRKEQLAATLEFAALNLAHLDHLGTA